MNAIILQLATYTLDWCKRNADATLILAIATETPRWTVVFTALHEPAWIGVTMGVLISWAAKRGWHAWKEERTRWGLFVLNAWVLASAVAIIAPVLFEMTKNPIELVNVSDALLSLHPYALWVWVLLVAQSTFMPLIQAVVAQPYASVAVVPVVEIALQPSAIVEDAITSGGNDMTVHTHGVAVDWEGMQLRNAEKARKDIELRNATGTTIKEKYLQLRAMGRTNADAAMALGVKAATAASWWSRTQSRNAMQGASGD